MINAQHGQDFGRPEEDEVNSNCKDGPRNDSVNSFLGWCVESVAAPFDKN